MDARPLPSGILFVCSILLLPAAPSGQSDTTAPVLTHFTFASTPLDTTGGAASVTVSFSVTDDLSGVGEFNVHFSSPSGAQTRSGAASFPLSLNHSGTAEVVFPPFGEAGTWRVTNVNFRDNVGNRRDYGTADLIALGFPTDLQVLSNPDSTPPQLTALSFAPLSVDSTGGPATVNVTFTVTDDLSGVGEFNIHFSSPSGLRTQSGAAGGPTQPTFSGTAPVTFPVFTESGIWTVSNVNFRDAIGNRRDYTAAELAALGFPTQVSVTALTDNEAPHLTGFSFTPVTISTGSGPASVTVNVALTDDITGVDHVNVHFRSPSGVQTRSGFSQFSPALSVSGSHEIVFPQFSETGTWVISNVNTADAAGNRRDYDATSLAALGFPTELTVLGFSRQLASLGTARLFVGLKNSDDQGTRFDIRTEVRRNGVLVSSGLTRCLSGLTRNPDKTIETAVAFAPITPIALSQGDELSMTVLTRIGTNPDGSKCPGHGNATGLRLYYDSIARPSRFEGQITPDPAGNFFLHFDGTNATFDAVAPNAATARLADSARLAFSGGNPWKEVGTWRTQIQ